MRFSTFPRVAAIALLATVTTPLAAQSTSSRPTFGVFAGAAFPTGDLGDSYDTGYNAGAFIGFTPASLPVGLRIDGAYNRFDVKSNALGIDAHTNVISGTVNAVIMRRGEPGAIRPYLIGGVGIYNSKDVIDGGNTSVSSESDTKFGVNGGAGLDLALSGISVFLEARYNYVLSKNDDQVGSFNAAFIPVVVGIRF